MAELIESEVATMKFLKQNSSIPLPDVMGHSSSQSNDIGIPFIITTKAVGSPLSNFVWEPLPEGKKPHKKLPCLKTVDKEKILRQLGAVTAQLLNLPLEKIGSLHEKDGEFLMGKCLSPAFTWYSRDSLGDYVLRGPFKSDKEYYESLIALFRHHAERFPLEHHVLFAPVPQVREFTADSSYRSAVGRWNDFVTVGSKIDSKKNRLDYCTVAHMLRDVVPSISANLQRSFYLMHPDISMSNIFVDDDFNITSIIDWTNSSTVPLSTLLITPSFPHARNEVNSNLVPVFEDSLIHHYSQTNKNILDAQSWDSTRSSWLFMRLVTLDGLQDYNYFVELYTSVFGTTDETTVRRLFNTIQEDHDFMERARTLAKADPSIDEILNEEEDYFCDSASGAEAIARKLTVVASLNQEFIADSKLWRWIEEATSTSGS
ncbi:hypothetical protein BP5796_08123 [Coleophoma crateriformis]|uniref:Aminoglycoside phosphotransferase domain-containing protein n=1 Tax=Coleophoma crateriformis TaxID=565419 RepID=A0A3D8RDG1_9HELO|nr:hypothetical protein BP5796_08123 [Coleophoma crateriformis]